MWPQLASRLAGPDGARVLNAVIEGANTARLRRGGHLAIVSEFPNVRFPPTSRDLDRSPKPMFAQSPPISLRQIRDAHATLAALQPGLRLALFYDPLHVQARPRRNLDRNRQFRRDLAPQIHP